MTVRELALSLPRCSTQESRDNILHLGSTIKLALVRGVLIMIAQ